MIPRFLGFDVSEDGLDLNGFDIVLVTIVLLEGVFGDPHIGG